MRARVCVWCVFVRERERERERERGVGDILFYCINLIQVHNYMVSVQDILIFGRISIFSVLFTEIKQRLMQRVQYSTAVPDREVAVVKNAQARGCTFDS